MGQRLYKFQSIRAKIFFEDYKIHTSMCQDVTTLGQPWPKLSGKNFEPILDRKVLLVVAPSSKTLQRYLGLSTVKGRKVFVIYINTVQFIFNHPSRHSISSLYRIGTRCSGDVSRSEEGDNQTDAFFMILTQNWRALTSWKLGPFLSLRTMGDELLKTLVQGIVDPHFVPCTIQ